jgi:hypothetical protein
MTSNPYQVGIRYKSDIASHNTNTVRSLLLVLILMLDTNVEIKHKPTYQTTLVDTMHRKIRR